MEVSPIVKWAGGKRQLLPQLTKLLPPKFNVYYEPFVGGGALLTELYNRGKINRAIISDTNKDLINLYRIVKTEPESLVYELERLKPNNTAKLYYDLRKEFNRTLLPTARKGALFLYLNRYGFNGVWRVNSRGEFNVPFGRHVNPNMLPIWKIMAFSKMLQKVKIMNRSFELATKTATKGDLVYYDPPYLPISKSNGFTNYTSQGFMVAHQIKLSENFKELNERGVYLMLSNSDVPKVRELYDGFYFHRVTANRMVNSQAHNRKGFKEVIITNYKTGPTLDSFTQEPK